MNITVEQVKTFKEVSDDLFTQVEKAIDSLDWTNEAYSIIGNNGLKFEYNGICFSVWCIDEGTWDDEGKYQYSSNLWQLVSFDKSIASYACKKSIVDKYNLFIKEDVSRTGSYYSDYYYSCDFAGYSKMIIKTVPEVIIPEHEETEFETLKGD